MSGPLNFLNTQGYMVIFLPDPEAAGAGRLGLLTGDVAFVQNALQRFSGDPPDIGEYAEGVARGFQFGVSLRGDSSVSVEAPVALPARLVGEESRAYSVDIVADEGSMTTAIVVFRRGGDYVVVAAVAVSDEPPLDETLRLADIVDGRLMSAGGQR